MAIARKILLAFGALVVLTGLLWMGQGSGYFPYPASSFMIDESSWIWRGFATAAVGAGLIACSRIGRRPGR